ncbi:MAG TPA: PDZ domain-containing protein [Acidobacteriaceae bacterium]|jgi:S1-C subfamily serine protease|nr:PDZ domain-containing protein [Acidobacteriaceae bacterium]
MKNKIFRATIILASTTLVASSGAKALGGGPPPASSSVVAVYFHHDRVGYLGVDFEDLTAQQRSTFHLQGKQGVAIAAVDHDAPAGQAGLRAQDVVIEMNGQPAQNAAQLRSMLKKATVGQTVELTILRDGQTFRKSVQLADRKAVEERAWSQHYTVPDPSQDADISQDAVIGPLAQPPPPPQQTTPAEMSFLGEASSEFGKAFGSNGVLMSLIPGTNALYTGVELDILGPQLAQYFGVKNGAGLLVKSVDLNSPGSRAGIRAGDIVLKVDDVPMVSRSKWQHVIHENRNSLLLLQVQRDKQQMTLTMSVHDTK